MSSVQNSSAPYQDAKGPAKPSSPWDVSGFGGHDRDGSGAESGDSEIEQVAEEPDSPRLDKIQSTKGGFGQSGNPFGLSSNGNRGPDKPSNPFEMHQANKLNTSNPFELSSATKGGLGQSGNPPLYSLLREEREAELDSDLLIESASEESPKREQGYCPPKPSSPPAPNISTNPISPPRPTTESVANDQKQKEKENMKDKEKEKEKDSAEKLSEKAKPQPQPQQHEEKPRPSATGMSAAVPERRPLENLGSKSSGETKAAGVQQAEVPPFLQNFNKQKGKNIFFSVK